ncbi:MAG: Got1/Sft2-like family vesicle transport protein [Deltaproteobacteria bacterium]|nr:Got1/Sft2-like family vesicle transport protein [Deltaproteobacteria bacterium]
MDKEEEKNEQQDKVNELAPNEKEEQKAGPAQKKRLGLGRLVQFLLDHKWSFLLALGSFFILIGLGITIGPKWLNDHKKRHPVFKSGGTFQDNLQEEGLSPFFIPLPPGSPKRVVVIDFSVIWDGLASVRFKKKELKIREQKAALLETEMSRIFRESLGIESLEIKIKQINYL